MVDKTDTTDEAAEWGYVDREPELVDPHPDIAAFTASTWNILAWLSRQGLRPTQGETWKHPPQMTVHFGAGSGWLSGTLTIFQEASGVTTMRAHWIGADGKHRFTVTAGSRAILAELNSHESQRVARIRRLAQDNGLSVFDHEQ